MLILRKKRIFFIIVMITLSISTFLISNKNKVTDTVQTVSLPVNGKTIVLDAGHGLPDKGAQSASGVSESDINLCITKKVQLLLEQSGCNVILTRANENGIYDLDSRTIREKKVSDIKNRVKIGNESSADAFVSIHLNKIPQQQYDGWQTFYNAKSAEGQRLAVSIQNTIGVKIENEINKTVSKTEVENEIIKDYEYFCYGVL